MINLLVPHARNGDPGRGRTKTGRLWVHVRDDRPAGSTEPPAAWYRYSPNRKGEHPQAHLRDYRGILQADAYGGYGKISASGQVDEALCWAHARRPFWDMYENQGRVAGSVAEQALQRIATVWWRRPSSTGSIRRLTCGKS